MPIRPGTTKLLKLNKAFEPSTARLVIADYLINGLTTDEIAKRITDETGINISGRTVARWAKQWSEDAAQK